MDEKGDDHFFWGETTVAGGFDVVAVLVIEGEFADADGDIVADALTE